MAKDKVIMFNLDDPMTKHLAEALTNETSRKMLSVLAEQDATSSELAKKLDAPLNTIHYNIQKLKEANLIINKGYHYSEKGKKVETYALARQYILITPGQVKGVKGKIGALLPILALVGMGVLTQIMPKTMPFAEETAMVAADSAFKIAPMATEPGAGLLITLIIIFIYVLGILMWRKQ